LQAACPNRLLFVYKEKFMKLAFFLASVFIFWSCRNNNVCSRLTVDDNLVDSVKKKSDTSYTKRYRNKEFAVAEYYINRKDTTVCQLMKDTTNQIRQIIITKNDVRLYTAEYYSNGQLKAHLPFDEAGKLKGEGEFYFENGCVKNKGAFNHGLYRGEWTNYNDKGQIISRDQYDSNGQLIKTISVN